MVCMRDFFVSTYYNGEIILSEMLRHQSVVVDGKARNRGQLPIATIDDGQQELGAAGGQEGATQATMRHQDRRPSALQPQRNGHRMTQP